MFHLTMARDRQIAELYRQHAQGLFSVGLAILRDSAAAEDAVHDAVSRLLASTRAERDPVAYLYAAVRNAARDLLRRRKVRSAQPIDEGLFEDALFDDSIPAERSDLRRALATAMDALPPEQQEVLLMRAVGRLGFEQIAAAVGAPLGTVASRYSRGVEALRHQLQEVVQ
ncbi:MAG: sigma-70 family RNA polymerase sigma factor [Phycisphaeraceae bacterium]|nr:sigma-70 family RNA polymerase sigma factor [Phycisphaeraceae bacterium]